MCKISTPTLQCTREGEAEIVSEGSKEGGPFDEGGDSRLVDDEGRGTSTYDLSEEELLELIVHGEDSGSGDTTEDVGSGTLEERGDTLGLDDLPAAVDHAVVVDLLSRGHHHATTDGIERVGSDSGTGGDSPSEGDCEQRGLDRVDEDE